MARIRTIKPEFFFNERLAELESETGLPIRLAYIGLWCQCDREGRFEWRPKRLKAQIFPYEDIDLSRVLHALTTRDFLVRYAVNGVEFGWIPGFLEHQVINNKERDSVLPEPNENNILTRESREGHAKVTRLERVPIGREGNKEGNKKGGAAQKAPTPIPEGVDEKAWKEFDQHRRSTSKLRSTWNDLAKTKAANQLRGLSAEQQREAVDYSITGGYPGLYVDRVKKIQPNEPDYPDLQA